MVTGVAVTIGIRARDAASAQNEATRVQLVFQLFAPLRQPEEDLRDAAGAAPGAPAASSEGRGLRRWLAVAVWFHEGLLAHACDSTASFSRAAA